MPPVQTQNLNWIATDFPKTPMNRVGNMGQVTAHRHQRCLTSNKSTVGETGSSKHEGMCDMIYMARKAGCSVNVRQTHCSTDIHLV